MRHLRPHVTAGAWERVGRTFICGGVSINTLDSPDTTHPLKEQPENGPLFYSIKTTCWLGVNIYESLYGSFDDVILCGLCEWFLTVV